MMMSLRQDNHSNSNHESFTVGSPGLCVCVFVFKYEHTYVEFFDICRDLPVKESGKKKRGFVLRSAAQGGR